MNAILIWTLAALAYAMFWVWYSGLGRKIKPEEVEPILEKLKISGNPSDEFIAGLRTFFLQDDGKDFVMVNLLELKRPHTESIENLNAYQKVFLGNLLKRAGHPIFVAKITNEKIENLGCDEDHWTAAGMIRYRSRRDLMEILPETAGSQYHRLKLAALERTFAYPAPAWFVVGGPKLLVPLAIISLASLAHLLSIH